MKKYARIVAEFETKVKKMNNICPYCHAYCTDDEVQEGVCAYCGYQVSDFEWEYDNNETWEECVADGDEES